MYGSQSMQALLPYKYSYEVRSKDIYYTSLTGLTFKREGITEVHTDVYGPKWFISIRANKSIGKCNLRRSELNVRIPQPHTVEVSRDQQGLERVTTIA